MYQINKKFILKNIKSYLRLNTKCQNPVVKNTKSTQINNTVCKIL